MLKKYSIVIFIGIGLLIGYLFGGFNSQYQGKTAQEWAEKEASGQAEISYWKSMNCKQINLDTVAGILWHFTNCSTPTPTPSPQASQQSTTEFYNSNSGICRSIVRTDQALGYSINGIKADIQIHHPECLP